MTALTSTQEHVLRTLALACSEVPGVTAVALGGSHARGRARPDSDIDIALLYARDKPLSIETIRAVAEAFNDTPSPTVSGLGEWGRWVDGGAWLTVQGVRADLLYRNIEQVEDTWQAAVEGRYELDYGQQPPFGFFGPVVLGETVIAAPLHDEHGEIARLKALVSHYPDRLRRSVVQANLWDTEFGLNAFAPKFASAGNAYGAAGCFARAGHRMVLALFALNQTWLLNDKTALDEINEFPLAPPHFGERLKSLLGHPGSNVLELQQTLASFRQIFAQTAALAADLYRPSWTY